MKVALCLSGMPRTFKLTLPSMQKYILEPLQPDVFIHTYSGEESLEEDLRSAYSPTTLVIQDYSEIQSRFLNSGYDKHKRPETKVENVLSMFYKICECNKLKIEHEANTQTTYDLVIRARLDMEIQHFSSGIVNFTNKNEIYIPIIDGIGFNAIHNNMTHWWGYTDQFAFGCSESMNEYSKLYERIDEYWRNQRVIFHPETMMKHHLDSCRISVSFIDIRYSLRRE